MKTKLDELLENKRDQKRKIDELHEEYCNQKKEGSRIYLSTIGPTEFAKMEAKAGLAYRIVEVPLLGEKAGTHSFEWGDKPEKAHADRLQNNLSLR